MKQKNRLIILGIVLIAVVLSAVSYFGIGTNKQLSASTIKQGLDLRGGVAVVYEADGVNPTPAEMDSAISLIRGRLDRRGSTESTVAQQGSSRIRIEMPGVSDPEAAVREIGQTAQLTFEDESGNVVLKGFEHVKDAYKGAMQTTQGGVVEYVVHLEFTDEGRELFKQATEVNLGKRINIVLDGRTISSPTVQTAITDGKAYISGDFTPETSEELAQLIKAGSLPFALKVVNVNVVGARLGANSLEKSLLGGAIGAILVLLFMIAIYKFAGLAADLALVIYVALDLLVLSLLGVTLTLPGIAGIILSIGMAVDANVIIFERLKEEILNNKNKAMKYAVESAFKSAFSAILDGNVTTLISALVLFWLGTGPVKGFAQTLAIGIILSMFTALVVTRVIMRAFIGAGLNKSSMYMPSFDWKFLKKDDEKQGLPIIENRRKYYVISGVVIVAGLAFMLINGISGGGAFNFDVDFSGGTSLHYDLKQDFNNTDIDAVVQEITGQTGAQIHKIVGTNEVSIKLKNIDSQTRTSLTNALIEKYGITNADLLDSDDVAPTISTEMQRTAFLAVSIACIAMLIYVSFRFKNIVTGGSAILALVHDALVVLAAYAIFRVPLNYTFIAAILTVVGYSINATIVIFDRMRADKQIYPNRDNKTLVNSVIMQTLPRSVYTSLTTLIVIILLYITGVTAVKDFAMPIIVGIIAGTYSSIFLSVSIWYTMTNRAAKKK